MAVPPRLLYYSLKSLWPSAGLMHRDYAFHPNAAACTQRWNFLRVPLAEGIRVVRMFLMPWRLTEIHSLQSYKILPHSTNTIYKSATVPHIV